MLSQIENYFLAKDNFKIDKPKYNISDKKKINGCNIEELNKQIEELNSILN